MKYLLLVVFILVISCNSTKNTTKDIDTLGSKFKVEEMANSEIELKMKPTLYFDFKKNTITGNAGCNKYSGVIVKKGNQLKFSGLVSTKMYCGNMKIEKEFIKKMGTVTSYKIKDSQFLLYNSANELVLTCEVN